jgi:thiamine kinase-like enzyme
VIAVLDWELASIGDPMMDLAYACMIYHWPEEIKVIFPNHDDGMYKIFDNYMCCQNFLSFIIIAVFLWRADWPSQRDINSSGIQ